MKRAGWRGTSIGLALVLMGVTGLAGKAPTASRPQRPVEIFLHARQPEFSKTERALTLSGAEARQQLLVTARNQDGSLADVTRTARYVVIPRNIALVDSEGLVVPRADGQAVITATLPGGLSAKMPLVVTKAKEFSPVNFANQISPLFTKAGCNAGGCHGKSEGQNGFRLSLLGFEPREDYEYLVKEARGRRVFPAAPERSLLIQKATGDIAHGGGKRIEPGSPDHQLLLRWVAQGMPYGLETDPVVSRIEVLPKERTLRTNSLQQLVVLAHYSDGSVQEVTRSAQFEANEKDLANVDSSGLVKVMERPGDVAVMARYQAKVAVFGAMIPVGAPVDNLPVARNIVDEAVFAKLKRMGLPPSGLADDATFIRRVTLDIAGRLPTTSEAAEFLAENTKDKRDRLVDRLLDSPDYADYFAGKWAGILRNKRTEANHTRGTYAFYSWIRDSLLENKPYDQFMKEILAASGDLKENPPVAWYRQARSMTTQIEDTAQVFLGQRLQCAQCHHHPFEKWSQSDYYQFGAFFSQVGRRAGSQAGEEMVVHKRGAAKATHPKSKVDLKPAGLGARAPELGVDDDPRLALASWMSSKDNPFFAKALVNRYWKHFFNRGIVDPEDDLRETNPAVNPALLEALARDFAGHGFDLKRLIRLLCTSTVYQLSSTPNAFNQEDRQNFSRYYPRRLTAETLLDSVNVMTGAESRFEGLPAGTRAVQLPDNSFNNATFFLSVFGRPEMSSSCECERSGDASLSQSLHLLNSKDIQTKLASDTGRAAQFAKDDKRTSEDLVQELYLAAFARSPTKEELKTALDYLARHSPPEADKRLTARRAAFEDLILALVSTKEFLFNH